MSLAEQLGLRELQQQFPNSHISIDRHGVAIIDPVDTRLNPRKRETEQEIRDLSAGIGRTTLLRLEVEEQE